LECIRYEYKYIYKAPKLNEVAGKPNFCPTPVESGATPAESGATPAESSDSIQNQWGTEKDAQYVPIN